MVCIWRTLLAENNRVIPIEKLRILNTLDVNVYFRDYFTRLCVYAHKASTVSFMYKVKVIINQSSELQHFDNLPLQNI